MKCSEPGCERAAMTSSGGNLYTRCEAHVRALLSGAFAPTTWHDRARLRQLPSMVVGGVRR